MLCITIIIASIILNTIPNNEAYRILLVVPMPSKSHGILGHGIARHLLEAGHEVVHVTCFPKQERKANYSEVSLAAFQEKIHKLREEVAMFKLKNMVGHDNAANYLFVLQLAQDFHRQIFDSEDFKKLMNDPKEKFDAVIVEWFYFDGIAGIASIFQCPLIWLATTEAHWNVLKVVDEIPNPAYSTDILSSYRPPLTFWQRAMELRDIIYKKIMIRFLLFHKEKSIYNKLLSEVAAQRGVNLAPYEDAVYNGSLLLINSHPSYGSAFKLPQNAKYVGGFHVETTNDPLTKDFQQFMDNAKDGVIFFSMGTNFRSAEMSDEMKSSLLNTFAKLRQKVIWKFESELENVPPNVKLVKWAPQQGILAHQNIRIFITHGGQLSTTEAIHYGVPLIGIPVAADQHVNMMSVTSKGFGVTVQLSHDMGPALNKAIDQILNDPFYNNKTQEISGMYHDRPLPPGKELVYWVEHVVRTRGAPHLRSPALMVSWYQKMFLDLLSLFILIAVSVLYAVKYIVQRIKNVKQMNIKKVQ